MDKTRDVECTDDMDSTGQELGYDLNDGADMDVERATEDVSESNIQQNSYEAKGEEGMPSVSNQTGEGKIVEVTGSAETVEHDVITDLSLQAQPSFNDDLKGPQRKDVEGISNMNGTQQKFVADVSGGRVGTSVGEGPENVRESCIQENSDEDKAKVCPDSKLSKLTDESKIIGVAESAERVEDVTSDLSLDTLPSPDDTEVKAVYNEIAGLIMLHLILNIFSVIGKYFRITVNATADDVDSTVKHQEALFESLKLCDTFSLMMQNYHSGANNILEKLKIAYLYLLDGFPDFAIADINAISKDVDAMRKAVGKVTEKVKYITTLTSALILTTVEPGEGTTGFEEPSTSEEIPGEENSTHSSNEESVQLLIEGIEWPDNGKEVSGLWETGVEETPTCFTRILKWNLPWVERYGVEYRASLKNKSDGVGCKYTKSQSYENEEINSQSPPKIVNLRVDERNLEMKEARETDLRNELVKLGIKNIENNLRQLKGILSKSSILVENWYKECSEIVEPSMTKNVEAAEALAEEEKMKYWASAQFQQDVVNYYYRWRALEVYSQDCRGKVRQVRGELDSYYTENLRPKEAVKFSWKLAKEEADEEIQAVVEKYKSMKD